MEFNDEPINTASDKSTKDKSINGFNFLKKYRTATQRAEQLGRHLAGLTHFKALYSYPDVVKKFTQNRDGSYLTEEETEVYKSRTANSQRTTHYKIPQLTTEYMIIVEPVRLKDSNIIAVRKKSEYKIAQLVIPDMITYVGSVAATDEVLACADEAGNLFGPFGGQVIPVSAEYVENLDAVLTQYSLELGLPEPGRL
jgi:hypothetical protein